MAMRRLLACLLFAAVTGFQFSISPAAADEQLAEVPTNFPAKPEEDPAFISLSVGYFDINKRDDTAADFRIEYRGRKLLWIVKPWAGVEFTSDGAFYALGGIMFDIFLGRRLVLTPSAGAGYWSDGGGKELGNNIQFRTQIEGSWRFDDRSRLGVAFSHISNASLGNDNPGVEILSLYYSIPFSKIF